MSIDAGSERFYEFDVATQVQQVAVADIDGSVSYRTRVHPGWDIMGNANGGYLLALVGHALTQATQRNHCITVTAHYLAPCPAGEARIVVTPVRSGRLFATATASLLLQTDNGEKEVLRVLATLGNLQDESSGPTQMSQTLENHQPLIAPFEDCVSLSESATNNFAYIHDRLATRAHPGDIAFRDGEKSGVALIRGWFAFKDQRPIDTRALLLASDAFPPSVFNLNVPTGWVPTIELTVHTRAIPAGGPIACFFTTRYLQNGLLEEDGEMWDVNGVLVAQSRQLALAPRQK